MRLNCTRNRKITEAHNRNIMAYIIFEFFIVAGFCMVTVKAVKKKDYQIILVSCLAMLTVSTGEYINSFFTKVTVYNDSFLLWIPETRIPVFIIFAGALLSVILFKASQILSEKIKGQSLFFKLFCTFALTLFLPIIEIAGIKTGLWQWQHSYEFNLNWYAGVWIFYFIFIALPAVAGHIWNRIRVLPGD